MRKVGRPKTHGMCGTRFYKIWEAMKRRCNSPKACGYHNYGGRGIGYCDEWENFNNFYKEMYHSYCDSVQENGEKDTTIDRIDNNKDYCLNNCRWLSMSGQAFNRRQNTIVVKDIEDTVIGWAKRSNLNYYTIIDRIRRGWSEEDAVLIKRNGKYGDCGK